VLRSKIGTSIQGLEHEEAKREGDSPSFDPPAIAVDGNRRNGIKRAIKEN
jgi:hypothetical protein